MAERMLQCMVPQTDRCLYFAACVNSLNFRHYTSNYSGQLSLALCKQAVHVRQVLLQSGTSVINLFLNDEARNCSEQCMFSPKTA